MALSRMQSSLRSKTVQTLDARYWMIKLVGLIKLIGLIELIDLVYAQDIRRRAEVIFSISRYHNFPA